MKILEERIVRQGLALSKDILKVDQFLNHQVDSKLMYEMALEFKRLFANETITKVLTIEASGIAIASMVSFVFDVPFVFAKKAKSLNLEDNVYTSVVHSFTYAKDYNITVSKNVINSNDHILLIDDFLANGMALNGLIDICNQAGATVSAIGIAIEKGFQSGGMQLREKGYHLESLAIIESMDKDHIEFKHKDNHEKDKSSMTNTMPMCEYCPRNI